MPTVCTQVDFLACDLEGFTKRLHEIIDTRPDYPIVRAKAIVVSAFIALWVHSEPGPAEEALNDLVETLSRVL